MCQEVLYSSIENCISKVVRVLGTWASSMFLGRNLKQFIHMNESAISATWTIMKEWEQHGKASYIEEYIFMSKIVCRNQRTSHLD